MYLPVVDLAGAIFVKCVEQLADLLPSDLQAQCRQRTRKLLLGYCARRVLIPRPEDVDGWSGAESEGAEGR